MASGAQVASGRFVLAGEEIGQSAFGWTEELVVWLIVLEVVRTELVFADDVRVAVVMGILVEGVVFEIIAQAVFFQVNVIFLTAIGGIRHHSIFSSNFPSPPLFMNNKW